jgi:hypothetical protein
MAKQTAVLKADWWVDPKADLLAGLKAAMRAGSMGRCWVESMAALMVATMAGRWVQMATMSAERTVHYWVVQTAVQSVNQKADWSVDSMDAMRAALMERSKVDKKAA